MAKADNKPQEIPGLNTPTTQEMSATGSTSGQTATISGTKEVELRERERALEERLKQVEARERKQDSHDVESRGAVGQTGLVATSSSSARDTEVEVVNNAAHAVGLYDGTPLLPGVTKVSRLAWSKLFLADGKTPVPGALHHFFPTNSGRPDLQVVSVDNLSALVDEHAYTAISSSEDARRLSLFEQTETRPNIKAAISKRIAELKKADKQ